MAKKLTATTPVGTFTRKTDRTYTHVVVAEGVLASALARTWDTTIANETRFAADYAEAIARGDAGLQVCKHPRTQATAWDIKCAEQSYADGSYTRWLADSREHVAKLLADGRPTKNVPGVVLLGWCGRPDLASKLASREAGGGYYYGVRVYPVDAQ